MNPSTFKFLILAVFILIFQSITEVFAQTDSCETENAVTANEIQSWIEYLASDDLKGRWNGSEELKQAELWLIERFREFGINPLKTVPDYLQEYRFKWRKNEFLESNVIGFIPGSDPKLEKEYIILSAHIDHVGIQKVMNNDSIYNGANDNASGVSTFLGIGKTISKGDIKTGRSILLIAFSGEELGLHGSRYYTNNPSVSLKKTMVNINFEMTGHCTNLGRNRYILTGQEYSNLKDIIIDFNQDKDWQLVDTIADAMKHFRYSDNYSFATISKRKEQYAGVPAHTIVLHHGEDHVHRPWDEAEYINYKNMEGLIDHLADFIIYLSNYQGEINWDKNCGYVRK